MLLLKVACTLEAIVELGSEKINQIWRDGIGLKKGSSVARCEMKLLLEDYEHKKEQVKVKGDSELGEFPRLRIIHGGNI